MEDKKPELLADDKGSPSTMRAMSMMCTIGGILVGCLGAFGAYNGKDSGQITQLMGILLAAGFGGKGFQKIVELKQK